VTIPRDLAQGVAWRVRRVLNRAGVDVVPYRATRHPIARRKQLFSNRGIDCVLDVGANVGQYGQFLRRIGYTGEIRSFEPLESAFEHLREAAKSDPRWTAVRSAVGDVSGRLTMNVSANTECSSFLPMLGAHLAAYPDAVYVSKEEVDVRTVDGIVAEIAAPASIFLKVDAQGYERKILEGAARSLDRITGVQLELSLVALYEGEALMPEMINWLKERGLILMGIEPGSSDPQTGQLLQVDGLFFRA
jgi:FkbM family methyltransferase